MATREINYASLTQVVENPFDGPFHRMSQQNAIHHNSQARIAVSIWITDFHLEQHGGAGTNKLNLIQLNVPAVTAHPPHLPRASLLNYQYHRDIILDFSLDFHASSSPFNPKSWGFLIYPHDDDEAKDPFYNLIHRILFHAIIPLAHYYFQG